MKIMVSTTIKRMFKLVPTMFIVVVGLLAGGILAMAYNQFSDGTSYQTVLQTMFDVYSGLSFVLIVGILIWILCANCATGLFASEIHDGTIRLLLAKKITRYDLVLGKISGMLIGSIAYLLVAFASTWISFLLLASVDSDIIIRLLTYTIGYCVYGILVIYIVGAIGSVLSSCFKKKVPAILLLVIAATLIFGIIPIMRVLLQEMGIYARWHLYYLDINYHLSLLFVQCIQLFGGILENSGGFLNLFTGIFEATSVDVDIALSTANIYTVSKTLNGMLISGIYIALATVLYGLTFRNMARKDI